MFWEEDKDESVSQVSDEVVDLVYQIRCKCLPLDHAFALSGAIRSALPWIEDEPGVGIHLIHGAESGNGWIRPEDDGGALLHLSRRSRMTLRMPKARIEDARALSGQTLDIDGYRLAIGEAKVKLFSTLSTQFARYVVVPAGIDRTDEEAFMAAAAEQLLRTLGLRVRKMLCGRAHALRHPDGDLHTRSVMLADLEPADAIKVQQQALGDHRLLGCGLFIPHKGISAVHQATSDKKT